MSLDVGLVAIIALVFLGIGLIWGYYGGNR
jgi:hypothetical protein